ncbi:VOC family protein [Pseudodonghicola flavimaris]|uniref:VOC family protein n=1 Tax=Pseudodonghicola flavimaris TaxID=3050036 RepID=A0ABT7F0I0_9RHOB|nr:VOC family protein [Pseudodonghicola flavimaris]MDK3018102.1 VOC family protein [Pseudodonghicola flavimaris]
MLLDHIAVSGETLEEAAAAVEAALGVPMLQGGQHDVFITHNKLLGLADGLYLEAIAADPSRPAPERPRWFDLDSFSGRARPTNWICASEDLDALLAALPIEVGDPVSLTRGDLRWRKAVPADGKLPFDNLFPSLIEWNCEVHPATVLPPSGCALRRLIVSHPEASALAAMLAPHFRDARVVFEPGAPALSVEIDTPHGLRTLA